MLNNWDVGGGLSDFWDYTRQPRPHRWASWGVAVVLALVVFWGFGKYLIPYEKPKPQIIYFENWKADRSEAEVRADWIARAKETTRENARRRAEYQKLADMMGVPYDSSKADERSEEHTSELQSLMRISYAVFCLKKKKKQLRHDNST